MSLPKTLPVRYIGAKPSKTDNVTWTGLTWAPGQVHQVPTDAAIKLVGAHPTVWELDETAANAGPAPEPPAISDVPVLADVMEPATGRTLAIEETIAGMSRNELKAYALRHEIDVPLNGSETTLRKAIIDASRA